MKPNQIIVKALKGRIRERFPGTLFDPHGICERCQREAGRKQIAQDLFECTGCRWKTRGDGSPWLNVETAGRTKPPVTKRKYAAHRARHTHNRRST